MTQFFRLFAFVGLAGSFCFFNESSKQSFKPAVETIYLWSGALTPTTIRVNAKLSTATTQARIIASTNSDLSNPLVGSYAIANASNNFMAAMSISGLTPNTSYYYAIEVDGVIDNSPEDIGRFTTPKVGPQNFRFTVGSCNGNSAHVVFDKMGDKNPLFQLTTGDFHYDNPNSGSDINVHRMPYENNMLSQVASRNFFLKYPLAFVWDDHDYCGDNSDSLAAGRTNARIAYQEYVPHYPLAKGSGNVPIYQSFTIGRIHFILSDLRSMRGIGNTTSNDVTLSMMGTEQKQWFKDQCLYAKSNNLIIAWVSSVSYGGIQGDNWGGFPEERKELANFFQSNDIKNLFILSGDAHIVAIDNGSNHDFATVENLNDYPVFQAAALNRSGGYKGGVYSEVGPVTPNGPANSYLNPDGTFGQYGVVDILDAGGNQVSITFTAYRVTSTGAEELLVSYTFSRTLLEVVPVKFSSINISSDPSQRKTMVEWEVELDECREFEVERSYNGMDFTLIGSVPCTPVSKYSYADNNPPLGWIYYRVKAIDKNSVVTYSPIKRVLISGDLIVSIGPNPVLSSLRLSFYNVPGNLESRYKIYDADMRKLRTGKVKLVQGTNVAEIHVADISSGTYIIEVHVGRSQQVFKIVKR